MPAKVSPHIEVEAFSSTVTGLLFGVIIVRLGKGLFVFVVAAITCDTIAILYFLKDKVAEHEIRFERGNVFLFGDWFSV